MKVLLSTLGHCCTCHHHFSDGKTPRWHPGRGVYWDPKGTSEFKGKCGKCWILNRGELRCVTRWAPTSYKWSYKPYKWPYKWVTGVITLLIGVITPFITSRGPTLYQSNVFFSISALRHCFCLVFFR